MEANNWNASLKQLDGSFLQSDEWKLFQESLGREVVRESNDKWMWQAVVRGQKGLKYLYCSYGPAVTNEKVAPRAIQSLVDASKRLGCDFVRVEPRSLLQASKMRQMGGIKIGEVQPEHSQIIDLTQSIEDLRKSLASGHRNLVNGTERRGIYIKQTDNKGDFNHFLSMLDETSRRAKVTFFPKRYFEGLWMSLREEGVLKLYIAMMGAKEEKSSFNDKPVAAALFYDWGETRIYAHAGAYQEINRKANASVSLVWQAIMDAKNDGMRQFDLWGVAPDGASSHKWAGITKFKKGFGGSQVDYIGTWDIPIKKQKYWLYSLYRTLKGRK